MRFILLMIPKACEKAEPAARTSAGSSEAMSKYNEALAKAGVLLCLDGLHPPWEGARLTFRGRSVTVVDGPFAEAKETIRGYWLIQAKSKEEAVEWARRCPAQDGDTIEVRQVQEPSLAPAG
jgi:hypothetical protein